MKRIVLAIGLFAVFCIIPLSSIAQGPGLSVTVYNTGSDYCQNPSIAKTSAVVNISTATTTELVAAASGKKVYVCKFNASTGGTSPTALFKTGTKVTNPCDTGAASISGTYAPPTATMFNVDANGAVTMIGATSGELCVTSGGTTPAFQGVIVYVQR